jgi:NADPH-dependent 7-cyano-7-deazaguanine reductase QueF-like protein
MEDLVIGFCNAMGDNIWHAFLVFRNSRTEEYNTLHIRKGNCCPEFMDRAATEKISTLNKKGLWEPFLWCD